MRARRDYRKVIWIAVAYAAVLTVLHGTFYQTMFPVSQLFGLVVTAVNFAGEVLSWRLSALYVPEANTVAWWVWLGSFTFISSFVQGMGYAWLAVLSRRLWATHRLRAVTFPFVTVLIVSAAFVVGAFHFDKVIACQLGNAQHCHKGAVAGMAWTNGLVWAAIAFGLALVLVALLDAFMPKRSRAPRGRLG